MMKARSGSIAILTLGIVTLAMVELVDTTAKAAPDEDASSNGITVAPEDIHRLKVFVVDEKNKPIVGAKVRQNQVHMPPLAPSPNRRTAIKNRIYVADDTGAATLTWPGESVDLRIWVSKAGYVPLHAMWAKEVQADGDQIPNEFRFVMKVGTKIGGIVHDENGKPVKGAKVEIYNATSTVYSIVTNDAAEKPGIRPHPTAWLADDDSEIATDSEGKWTATNVPDDAEFQAADKNARGQLFRAPHFSKYPLRLRVKHSGYESFDGFDGADSVGAPTLRELRSQTAVVVLKKKHAPDANQPSDAKSSR